MDIKKAIQKRNKEITQAILVAQMTDTDGFKILKKKLEKLESNARFPDVYELTSQGTENAGQQASERKGKADLAHEIALWLEDQQGLALEPRKDPDTGEEEVLSEKKKK